MSEQRHLNLEEATRYLTSIIRPAGPGRFFASELPDDVVDDLERLQAVTIDRGVAETGGHTTNRNVWRCELTELGRDMVRLGKGDRG